MQNSENGISAYRPVNVFINGEYWGIYNLRERQDEYWMEDHFDISPTEVDFLEYAYVWPTFTNAISGNWDNWNSLETFISDNDMSLSGNYSIAEEWIDIDNYIDYIAFQVLIGNQDWCTNNIKFWRPYSSDGKWKWIMWDTDYALGNYYIDPIGQPEFNFFSMTMSWCGWGDDDYTWMFRNLMENLEFRGKYFTRAQDLLNTTFNYAFLESEFLALQEGISGDIDAQLTLWGGSFSNWNARIDHTLFFMGERPHYIRQHMAEKFEMDTTVNNLGLNTSPSNAGEIRVNTIVLNETTLGLQGAPFPWDGEYLIDQNIHLEATALDGFVFSHWQGDLVSTDALLEFPLLTNMTLEAVFEPIEENLGILDSLHINELMSGNLGVYPDESGEFEDWLEIYNGSAEMIDLGGGALSFG